MKMTFSTMCWKETGLKVFVKNIRSDGKLDISLRKTGMENLESGAQLILSELQANDGFITCT